MKTSLGSQQQTWLSLDLPPVAQLAPKPRKRSAPRQQTEASSSRPLREKRDARRSSSRKTPAEPIASPATVAQKIIARTLARDSARVTPETPLASLGADDLDAAEIVFHLEKELGLPEDTIWDSIAVRPIRLTPGELAGWLESARAQHTK